MLRRGLEVLSRGLWNTEVHHVSFKLAVHVLFISILNTLHIYTVKFIAVAMVLGHFFIYEILTEGS